MSVSSGARIEASADVSADALIDTGSIVWHLAQVREGASIGADCVIGRGAYIGPGVRIGRSVKVQNYALVYDPADVGDGAFIGPGAILTNDRHPRSVDGAFVVKRTSDWSPQGVTVEPGASIGAGAVCVAPITVGRWSMVGAGAVVVSDVPAFALVLGVPAKRVGWVGRTGTVLIADGRFRWKCPDTGDRYVETRGHLEPESG